MGDYPPKPPIDLEAHGCRFWTDVTGTYRLRVDELETLAQACREMDLIDELAASQRSRSNIAKGYNGQDVADPMISELRQHRITLLGHLKALKLPDVEGRSAGKKGETSEDVSEKARSAARARWDRVSKPG